MADGAHEIWRPPERRGRVAEGNEGAAPGERKPKMRGKRKRIKREKSEGADEETMSQSRARDIPRHTTHTRHAHATKPQQTADARHTQQYTHDCGQWAPASMPPSRGPLMCHVMCHTASHRASQSAGAAGGRVAAGAAASNH
eukprot:scaffold21812_cov110-Isochrysis_galbana.AAC.17